MRWLLPMVFLACGGMSNSSGTGGNSQMLLVQPTGGQSLSIPSPGGTLQLGAYVQDNDPYGGGTLRPVSATWSSSSNAVATVDKSGLVTAVANGNAVITASSDTASGTATVVVGGMNMGAVR